MAVPFGLEERGVCTGRELIGSLALFELGKPHADPDARLLRDVDGDRIEATTGFLQVGPAQPAHELIAAGPDDRIERPEPRADRTHDDLQDAVASSVSIGIVDDLEVVHVDEGQDEAPVRATRPVHLMREARFPISRRYAPVRSSR